MKLDYVNHVSVIGTGMIGASVAALFAGNGYPVSMLAVDDEQAKAGLARFNACFRDLITQNLVTEKQFAACSKLLSVTRSYADLADTDFIFECVFERTPVKHSVYALVEKHCRRFRAIASSTSAIAAEELAEGFVRKDRLVVAHPWNPPHLVPCVELVPGKDSSEDAVKTVYEVLESVGRKVVVMKKAAPGFIGNRLQYALLREAVHMMEQGIATPEDIDKTLKYSFAPRYTSIGIFDHFDSCGLDLTADISNYLFPHLCNADKAQESIRSRCEAGNLGQKTGKGIYGWTTADTEACRLKASKPYFAFFNWTLPEE